MPEAHVEETVTAIAGGPATGETWYAKVFTSDVAPTIRAPNSETGGEGLQASLLRAAA